MNNIIIQLDAHSVIRKVDFSFLEGKRVLVTGATGLLGTHFLAVLSQLNLCGAGIKAFAVCHSDPAEHTKEIAQAGGIVLIDEACFDADVIIHAAGYAQPSIFTNNPAETIRVNTTMTQTLLNQLLPGGKFLFVSTSEVYSGLDGYVDESAIGTTTPFHERACYIEGKRCGEAIVNAYRKAGVSAKSARLSLAYGPGTRKHDQRVMNLFIEQALTQGKVEPKYPGNSSRTFCYVQDAVEMMWQICLHGEEPVYNVGGKSVITVADLARHVGNIVGVPVTLPTDQGEMLGSPASVGIYTRRVQAAFHKWDFVSLEEGLRRTIDWQRELYR